MICVICEEPINIHRLRVAPNTKTCSPECSKLHTRNLKTEGERRRRALARQQREVGWCPDYQVSEEQEWLE